MSLFPNHLELLTLAPKCCIGGDLCKEGEKTQLLPFSIFVFGGKLGLKGKSWYKREEVFTWDNLGLQSFAAP